VGNTEQRSILDVFKRREQGVAEECHKNKPLCFQGRAYQLTHPSKVERGCTDADATLVTPMLVGVADGVSQIEDYGINPAELPNELLAECAALALKQLYPGPLFSDQVDYAGPIPLMRRAFENTDSLGSTTILLAVLDNSTKIHGKLHPMIAVMSVGDCEMLLLRRKVGPIGPLELVFHTEMQRIDGHAQTPLQVARVDDRVYEGFDERMTIDVIEKGSAVHCMCIFEGDIVLLGSDGVFDNLFLPELVAICNEMMPPAQDGQFTPTAPAVLEKIARRIVADCHKKCSLRPDGTRADTPIGIGGKVDDTSIVVGEVVEWTDHRRKKWENEQDGRVDESECWFGSGANACEGDGSEDSDSSEQGVREVGNITPLQACCGFCVGSPRSLATSRR